MDSRSKFDKNAIKRYGRVRAEVGYMLEAGWVIEADEELGSSEEVWMTDVRQ